MEWFFFALGVCALVGIGLYVWNRHRSRPLDGSEQRLGGGGRR